MEISGGTAWNANGYTIESISMEWVGGIWFTFGNHYFLSDCTIAAENYYIKTKSLYYFRGGVIICELAFILMSTLLVFYGESGHWLPYFCPQTNIWYFLIGIALWWIKDQVKQIHILIFAIGAFCAIIVKGYDSYSFFALCTALALCVYWKYGSIKLRKNKIITSLNRISYAFWLVHPIVVRLISVHIGIYLKHAAGVEYVEWLAVLVLSIMGSILLTEITSKRGGFVVMLRNSINDDIGGER